MAPVPDTWLVRFPDGRVLFAKSTKAVRYHIEAGRIPANSRVKRSSEGEWHKLKRTPEFADLMIDAPFPDHHPREPISPPTDGGPGEEPREITESASQDRPMDIQALGVASLVNELFNAVDSSLHPFKMWLAGITSLVWAVGFLALELLSRSMDLDLHWLFQGFIGGVLMVAAGLASSLLAQMTFVEVSKFRPARWKDVRPGLWRNTLKIALAQILLLGLPQLAIAGLREYSLHGVSLYLQGAALALRLVLEVVFWPLAGMSLLLGPILVVEECSLFKGLRLWLGLLRSDLSRVFLYETLAIALGLVLTLPLTFPVLFVSWNFGHFGDTFLSAVALATLHVLGGLAVTPLFAYLLVANVFIYLNLRYEFIFPGGK